MFRYLRKCDHALLKGYKEEVLFKFQQFMGVLSKLPFEGLEEAYSKLILFKGICVKQLKKKASPKEIMEMFFRQVLSNKSPQQCLDILFLFCRVIERQVVIFDALENSAFDKVHPQEGQGSLESFLKPSILMKKSESLRAKLEHYAVSLVLTAHPTQFYPESILHIISDLEQAIERGNSFEINELFLQLATTSFRNPKCPTPYDEARSLIQRAKNPFFQIYLSITEEIQESLGFYREKHPLITLGFWPGGDRDGNSKVTAKVTQQVCVFLKDQIRSHYQGMLKELLRCLTFKGLEKNLIELEEKSHWQSYQDFILFKQSLDDLCEKVSTEHDGLFIYKIRQLQIALCLFGCQFARLDIRQNSYLHQQVMTKCLATYKENDYDQWDETKKQRVLVNYIQAATAFPKLSSLGAEEKEVIDTLSAVKMIQQENGPDAIHRYIISNTQSASHILEVMLFSVWAGFNAKALSLDIVPLFETIDDLREAPTICERLLNTPLYRRHLKHRSNRQVIMMGFSDGTKDGGYITCNWEIFCCKQKLSQLFLKEGIHLVFFDGRGGPPARGGGNTHNFYKAMAYHFPQEEIQLTIQGQTISSKFGNLQTAKHNIEQLFTSGLEKTIHPQDEKPLTVSQYKLLEELSQLSFEAYTSLKDDPCFMPYLQEKTPLTYYGYLNIASRPPKRGKDKPWKFEDLRAISFVSAWSHIKINVPGFYGLGSALQEICRNKRKTTSLKNLYKRSLFFATLLDNAAQSLKKCNLGLTFYQEEDEKFGAFWKRLYMEYELTLEMLLIITEETKIMHADPVISCSIREREELTLPLYIIQDYCRYQLQSEKLLAKDKTAYTKLLLKTLPTIINASRNSA